MDRLKHTRAEAFSQTYWCQPFALGYHLQTDRLHIESERAAKIKLESFHFQSHPDSNFHVWAERLGRRRVQKSWSSQEGLRRPFQPPFGLNLRTRVCNEESDGKADSASSLMLGWSIYHAIFSKTIYQVWASAAPRQNESGTLKNTAKRFMLWCKPMCLLINKWSKDFISQIYWPRSACCCSLVSTPPTPSPGQMCFSWADSIPSPLFLCTCV